MKKVNGRRPLKKSISYMKRMITSGKWKENERIPTLSKISSDVKCSIGTVRKAIQALEQEKLLENNGSLGFYALPESVHLLYKDNPQKHFLQIINSNLSALDILYRGGIAIGKLVFLKKDQALEIHDIVAKSTINTTISDLKESLTSPITLVHLLNLKGHDLKIMRQKYFKQQELRNLGKVLLKHKDFKL